MIPLLLLAGLSGAPALAQDAPDTDAVEAPSDEDLTGLVRELRDELRSLRGEVESLKREAVGEGEAARDEARATADHARDEAPTVLQEARESRRALRARATGAVHTFGDEVVIGPGRVVDEIASMGGEVLVQGVVTGDVKSFGGDIRIARGGRVLGDARSFGGDIVIERGGVLEGVPETLGGRVRVEQGGVVQHLPVDLDVEPSAPSWVWGRLASFYQWLVFLLAFAGAGVLVVALFPDRIGKVADQLERRPLAAGLSGLAWLVGLTVLTVLFFWTILQPLVAAAALGLAWMLGFVGLCQMIGDRLPFSYKPHGRWLAFLVGSVIVSLLGALPWVGTITVVAASIFGIGAAFNSRFGSR